MFSLSGIFTYAGAGDDLYQSFVTSANYQPNSILSIQVSLPYVWNSGEDLEPGQAAGVKIRLTPNDEKEAGDPAESDVTISLAECFSEAAVGPNPVEGEDAILFVNLPEGAVVDIYRASGHFIVTVTDDGDGKEEWSLQNEEGHRVASGVYVCHAHAPCGEAWFKVVVIR